MNTLKTWCKNAFIAFSVMVVFLMIMIFPKSEAAVVVTDITATEFNTLISTNQAAWPTIFRGGGTGGSGAEQIRLARNMATPEVGGGTNTITNKDNLFTWSRPTEIEISIDVSGNISARAGATTVSSLQITRPFNQILIRVFDNSDFGASDLQSLKMNTFEIRNMFADGSGPNHSNDIVSIHNFGSQAPFSFTANWDPGSEPNSSNQYVWIVALQNPVIPEPSTLLLVGFSSLFVFRRRR